MIATHDSMRLPGISGRGFTLWKAVEVNLTSPLYFMTVRHGSDTETLALMFSNDHELVSFLTDNVDATPLSLDVLAARGADTAKASTLVSVRTLALHNPDSTSDGMVVLRLANAQTVRARDLAPCEPAVDEPMLLFEFADSGLR
jgi:hypothetical protein